MGKDKVRRSTPTIKIPRPEVSSEILSVYKVEVELRNFYESLIGNVKDRLHQKFIEHLSLYRKVEVGLAVKGMKTWMALSHLFFIGFPEDAEVLLRSLVDVVIDMRFISLEPEKSAQDFIDYQAAHRWRWLREAKRRSRTISSVTLAALEREIERECRDVFIRHPKWKTSPPISWSCDNTPAKLEKLVAAHGEAERVQYFPFMAASSHTHPNAVTVRSYFFLNKGRADFKLDPSVPSDSRVFMDACYFLLLLLGHLDPIINLKLGPQLQEAELGFVELMNRTLSRKWAQ
jgi:hypothetical protein